jgi:hypothetical protein
MGVSSISGGYLGATSADTQLLPMQVINITALAGISIIKLKTTFG